LRQVDCFLWLICKKNNADRPRASVAVMVVIVWQLDLQLPMQSVHFESQPERGVQHYVIKFVSDLRHVDGFVRVLRFSAPIKLTATILMKVALSTIKQTKKR